MGYQLGVDIGTSYTAAAVNRGGSGEVVTLTPSNPVMPSVVLLKDNGDVLVGEAAVRRGIDEPTRVAREFKRRLGDPAPLVLGGTPYGAEALMGHVLAEVVRVVTEREKVGPDSVVLTHPANYGPYKLDQMREVARLAGLDLAMVSFLSEPQAAAVSYASSNRVEPSEVVVVYDFGGGTFDAALVRREGAGFELLGRPEGMDRLGGIDIDTAILEYVDDALDGRIGALDSNDPVIQSGVARLKDDCRLAKEALSTDVDTAISVNLPGVQGRVTLTRAQLESMIRPRINETIDALIRAIETANLGVADVARVLLVGGSSRIPLVAALVRERTGLPVSLDAHPKFAIATGAAVSAGSLALASIETPPVRAPAPLPPPPNVPAAGSSAAFAVPAAMAAMATSPMATSPIATSPVANSSAGGGGRAPSVGVDKRRRNVFVGAAAAAVVTVAAIIVIVASRGTDPPAAASRATSIPVSVPGSDGLPSLAAVAPATVGVVGAGSTNGDQPTTAARSTAGLPTAAVSTTAVAPATTVAALPPALTFTDRIGFTGREGGGVIGVEATKAEVVEADGKRTAVIHTRVTNFAAADTSLVLVRSPVLSLADGTSVPARFKDQPTVPGGGTTAVDIVAPVDESFTFTGVSLVFGNNASNQTIIPFDASAKITTFTPIVDVGKGTTIDSGAGTVATITGGVLHADYKDGSKGNLQLELEISVAYTDPVRADASDIEQTFTLTLPDGTTASSRFNASIIFAHGNEIIDSGSTQNMTPLFEVTGTYAGQYTLSIGHQRSLPPNPTGQKMTMTFNIAEQP